MFVFGTASSAIKLMESNVLRLSSRLFFLPTQGTKPRLEQEEHRDTRGSEKKLMRSSWLQLVRGLLKNI